MHNRTPRLLVLSALLALTPTVRAEDKAPPLTAESCRVLELRSLGPTLTSGRIQDIAVDPRKRSVWYVAAASGGLWKTTNRGLTWKPIFDEHGSYSLGCVVVDPKNPDVVWLGTGENQSQRSVGFGDGVYKSTDAGVTWKNVGLLNSEHIGKILIDPRNSDVVYVASQGPLWAAGGDRGLFKTTDGGKSWQAVLTISPNTGVTDVCFDPGNPDVLYAASYQRRRHQGLLIGGGPESAIYKSEDGGGKWTKLTKGLPEGDLGRIALAVSPQKPDVVYALVTASGNLSGFFRSADAGATWERRSTYMVSDPQYYGEIYADPNTFDRVWVMDLNIMVTDDGGKTLRATRWPIHADNHALVFDPTDADHLLVGNDGGLWESYDAGKSWRHFHNLPVTQFYRVAVDSAVPFYNVYGGTQDNGTQGGPSRTLNRVGIRSGDWQFLGGGDGMQPRADPSDPDVFYAMMQNGAITRLDKRTSASVGIRPRVGMGERVRWNWDTPFLISPHEPQRLYFAGSRLYRSDNRGDAWTAISPDLTRQLDPDKMEVMGKVWGPEAVTKNRFTTAMSVASALDESPLREGLLYIGTDDGLIQTSEDGGKTWRKSEPLPGVPEMAYVSCVRASHCDVDTVYATFHHFQRGDFKPYVLRSTDRGKSWTSIAGDLPDRQPVWSLVEDHVNRDLLFAGTEFGLYFTVDGGKHWVRLKGGVPTIQFRDLTVQRREGDLVCATFGRGFYVLDDYTPLRQLTPTALGKEGVLFAPRRTLLYHEKTYVRAPEDQPSPNPPFGAILTYHLRDKLDDGAKIVLTVSDADGKTVRRLSGPATAGLHRVTWDLRGEGGGPRGGALVKAGTYRVVLAKQVKDTVTPLGEPQELVLAAIAGE
jgi:photosystem II stability/assembly factor-like uncharacterized protein